MIRALGSITVRKARRLVGQMRTLQRRMTARRRARRTLRDERLLVTQLGDSRLYYPSSSIIGNAVADGSGWEPSLATAMDVLLPRDEQLVIAEVGSNIGATLAQMISVRPRARYVCFEPSDRFREVLEKNARENDWNNIVIEDLLVGARAETVRLFTNTSTASAAKRHYGGHDFLDASERQVIRLDDYFSTAPRLDMIKTDTDGFDIDVLLGASALLARLRPVLYFELAPFLARSAAPDSGAIFEYLADLGYRKYVVLAQAGNPLSLTDDPVKVLRLADEHKYVDVLTASRAEQVHVLPQVVAGTE